MPLKVYVVNFKILPPQKIGSFVFLSDSIAAVLLKRRRMYDAQVDYILDEDESEGYQH